MARVKTATLVDEALNWAVANAEGATDLRLLTVGEHSFWVYTTPKDDDFPESLQYLCNVEYSTDPSLSWPIIDREKICLGYKHQADPYYCPINDPATNGWARTTAGGYLSYGPNSMIAALRCFSASKFGDEFDVPDKLLQHMQVAAQDRADAQAQGECVVTDLPKDNHG
jgi:hypothetical protein